MSARRFAAVAWRPATFAVPREEAGRSPEDEARSDAGGLGGHGGDGGAGGDGAPPRRRGPRLWKALAWAIVVPVLLVGL
ncbi:hypothetical protein ACLFKT_43810, partial [Paraburkholderia sp. BR14261]